MFSKLFFSFCVVGLNNTTFLCFCSSHILSHLRTRCGPSVKKFAHSSFSLFLFSSIGMYLHLRVLKSYPESPPLGMSEQILGEKRRKNSKSITSKAAPERSGKASRGFFSLLFSNLTAKPVWRRSLRKMLQCDNISQRYVKFLAADTKDPPNTLFFFFFLTLPHFGVVVTSC